MTKTMKVSAAVAFAAAMVVSYFLFFAGSSPEAEYLRQTQEIIATIKAATPDELGFAIKNNPTDGTASRALVSTNMAHTSIFNVESSVVLAPEGMADTVALLIGSMGDPTVTVSQALSPGTPPADIYFFTYSFTDSYKMGLSAGELTHVIAWDGGLAICKIPVDREISLSLLEAADITR